MKARIPWPNPLASTLGFSLKSLHLVFRVIPTRNHISQPQVDLADSVASVAESFLHQELTPREEATLWQSFHQESSSTESDHVIPGGLETSVGGEEGLPKFDNDPAGVSVFAGLIERLLARFEFDAEDIKITLVHPDNVQFTVSLQEIRYHTDSKPTPPSEDTDGESRTLSLTGLALSALSLLPVSFPPTPFDSRSVATSRPASRSSSSSSLDEDAQFAMSQSLAVLPPRPASPASSVSSSMYQSALSVASSPACQKVEDDASDGTASAPSTSFHMSRRLNERVQHEEEMMLSFGSQPITIKVTTPSPVQEATDEDPFLSSNQAEKIVDDELQVAFSMNILACAVRPWQIQALLRLGHVLAPPRVSSQVSQPQPSGLPALNVNANIRGVVILFNSIPLSWESSSQQLTSDFFERPLVPPSSDHGYTRLHLDTLSASTSISSGKPAERLLKSTISFDASITDISAFSFTKSTNDETIAFPLLITDPHLLAQYPSPHLQPESDFTYNPLPSFEIIDWTDVKSQRFGTKLSHWRCQVPKADSQSYPEDVLRSGLASTVAIRAQGSHITSTGKGKPAKTEVASNLSIHVAPLHIRVDLENMLQPGGLLSFFDELLPLETEVNIDSSISSQITIDEYSSGRGRMEVADELESPFGEPISPVDNTPPKVQSNRKSSSSVSHQ